MKITVVGLGYVGFANALLLSKNNEVVGVDILKERVEMLDNNVSPFNEPELSDALNSDGKRLSGSMDLKNAVEHSAFVLISTPTNYDEKSNYFDTETVESVIKSVIFQNPDAAIVIRSTVPVGFTDKMIAKYKFPHILFAPEFLREGRSYFDCLHPSRIIVGGDKKKSTDFANLLFEGSEKKNAKVIITKTKEAEAIKLFSNTYLAMRIAFFNELDSYAFSSGMKSQQIIEGVCMDPRIGHYYNNPSFGYGGYCLPKDTKQLLANYENVPQNMIRAVVEANSTRKDFLANEIIRKKPKLVGVYRLAMKVGSDNFRESSIQGIMERLKIAGIQLVVYEPELMDDYFFGVTVIRDLDQLKRSADLIVANRLTAELSDVADKIFTRDLFGSD